MKYISLTGMFVIIMFSSINAQNFTIGANIGLPTGDFSKAYTFNVAIDASYLWEVSEKFEFGISSGYNHSIGNKIAASTSSYGFKDFQFFPIAGATRFNVSDRFTLGADIGFGISVTSQYDDDTNGLYYRPMIGYTLNEKIQLTTSYLSFDSNAGTGVYSTIDIGISYHF